jgi:two-component system, LytTR family, sensor kinase
MSELLNLVGLSTGVALYAMLLTMVVRASRAPSGREPFDLVLLSTALLGLVWNLFALPAYELPKVGIVGPFPWLVAIGFSALGFLPAVVVHSVLREGPSGIRGLIKRLLAALAYAVSSIALVLQFQAAARGSVVPSALAMQLLTYTFIALVLPLAAVTRGQPGARRALWIAALAIFAVSALHLSQFHQGEASWPIELLGHHASVPLAFAMLYQDYPFALADLFLKRALALLLLVSTSLVAIALFGVASVAFARFVQMDPRQIGALVTVWVATALVYPTLRRGAFWFVDAVVLHRPDYRSLRATISRRLQTSESTPEVLSDVCTLLAPALNARSVVWRASSADDDEALGNAVVLVDARAATMAEKLASSSAGWNPALPIIRPAAIVVIPTAEAPRHVLVVSELMGGRRLLSDDVATLETVGLLVARRLDAIRITRERYERELREQEIERLTTEAELRALRAQINPHFLFNALTTIGYLIQTAPTRALETLMRLTALLRGVLRSESEFTTLGRELEIVESYLDIEHARFEHRLRVRIDVASPLKSVRVPPLLLQPLVENAVKHGIAPLREGGEVVVSAELQAAERGETRLALTVRDTGVGTTLVDLEQRRRDGVGLRNVERRLACQYGEAASLVVRTAPGDGMTVTILLPAEFVAREHPTRKVV